MKFIRILIVETDGAVFYTVDPPHALAVDGGAAPTYAQTLADAAMSGMRNLCEAATKAGLVTPIVEEVERTTVH